MLTPSSVHFCSTLHLNESHTINFRTADYPGITHERRVF